MGVQRLVALRGDLPADHAGGGEFQYASDLVAFIRPRPARTFTSRSRPTRRFTRRRQPPTADCCTRAAKARAGADSAITQYFYNPDAYFRLVDDALALGLRLPIVPGILPIVARPKLIRFSDACGAEIPRWLRLRLHAFDGDSASVMAFGLDVVTDLCERLLAVAAAAGSAAYRRRGRRKNGPTLENGRTAQAPPNASAAGHGHAGGPVCAGRGRRLRARPGLGYRRKRSGLMSCAR